MFCCSVDLCDHERRLEFGRLQGSKNKWDFFVHALFQARHTSKCIIMELNFGWSIIVIIIMIPSILMWFNPIDHWRVYAIEDLANDCVSKMVHYKWSQSVAMKQHSLWILNIIEVHFLDKSALKFLPYFIHVSFFIFTRFISV